VLPARDAFTVGRFDQLMHFLEGIRNDGADCVVAL
jgi:hypothetical protein